MTRWFVLFDDDEGPKVVMARDEAEALRMVRMLWPKRTPTAATPVP